MIKNLLLALWTALVCTAYAAATPSSDAQAALETPTPNFGVMGRFIGQKFVAKTSVLSVSTIDNGNTLVIGNLFFRHTPDGKLQVWNVPAVLDKLKASIGADGSLNVQGETWDDVFKYKFQLNEYGGFTEQIDRKSLAGLNFLSSFEYAARNDYMPHTEANVRSEAASAAYWSREAAQNEADARAAKRESDRALANAYHANINSLAASTAQQAQANAQRDAMLANINAQAEAQRQAQAAQAQRQATQQQRQSLENNARWQAEKEQAAAQHQQQAANAQDARASQRAEQQRAEQQRQHQVQADARERAKQQERQTQADAQLRVQDQQRAARAQALQQQFAQQRADAAQKAEQLPRRTDHVAGVAPAGGKDLNCLTEGACRKACPARDPHKPSVLQDCLNACSRRSSCQVSYQ